MKMKFGRQGFLNPADSEDSGYFKFSLNKKDETPGRVTVFYRIADCSQNIELDFSSYGVYDAGDGEPAKIKEEIATIKARRKKMKLLAKSVAEFADKYEEAMAEAQRELEEYL